MPIETLEDIVESLANGMGIYGSHNETYCADDQLCRCCWTANVSTRIRQAVDIERRLNTTPIKPSYLRCPYCIAGQCERCANDDICQCECRATAKPAEPPATCAHIVNPSTDRCVMCGKNRFNRELEAAKPAEPRK